MAKNKTAVLPPTYDDSLAARAHWGVPSRQLGVRVSLGVWAAIRAAANHHGVRISDVVRAALVDWLVANGFIQRAAGGK